MWSSIFLISFGVLFYHRASLAVWTLSIGVLMVFLTFLSSSSVVGIALAWLIYLAVFLFLNIKPWRQRYFSHPILKKYRSIMPKMSNTEREALQAGSVSWEGDLFQGAPNFNKLMSIPSPHLSSDEIAFINGPLETLCGMIDDWEITHQRADLSPELWQYIKQQGFFGLIIPKRYGGKEFSAYAHSEILIKIYGRSSSVATTIAVPNSLGPAELLLHYGTDEQKEYYLPRLASGEEVPCFALTGPDAGSDAGAMTDTGIICFGEHEGQKVLGIRLNWNKRYITLAPIATVIGLAFKLYDPDHLLGKETELGITCALIPRNTPGITIGRRHFPVNIVFQNGPILGKDVFIPLDWIIGGPKMAGHGWAMLMECLAAGRGISLPASALGGGKVFSFASGAYARIRQQFNVPIGQFEGIKELLARIAGFTYAMDATRRLTVSAIDQGEKPAVASAITKYHVTELGRIVTNAAMDLHGGKGICLGPKNYLGRGYESMPIAITVEGANVLTRSMIIFGQGAMRCHPYIYAELNAALLPDEKERLVKFDKVLLSHMGYTFSNFIRSVILGLFTHLFASRDKNMPRRLFRYLLRFSSAFALLSDMSLLIMGGSLKRKESLSGRLGDALSYLYIISGTLKLFQDQQQPEEDKPLLEWVTTYYFYQIQQTFKEILQNFPNRFVAFLLRIFIFPVGAHFKKPKDHLTHQVADLLSSRSSTRARLASGAFLTAIDENILSLIEKTLEKTILAEPVMLAIKSAIKNHVIQGDTLLEQAQHALQQNIISQDQFNLIQETELLRKQIIAVDDFASNELGHFTHPNLQPETYACGK